MVNKDEYIYLAFVCKWCNDTAVADHSYDQQHTINRTVDVITSGS